MTPIAATLTRDRRAKSLVTLNGGPFNGVDIYPEELRHMAQQLLAVADMATKLPTSGKHWRPTTVTLGEALPGQEDVAAAAAGKALAGFENALSTVFKGMRTGFTTDSGRKTKG